MILNMTITDDRQNRDEKQPAKRAFTPLHWRDYICIAATNLMMMGLLALFVTSL